MKVKNMDGTVASTIKNLIITNPAMSNKDIWEIVQPKFNLPVNHRNYPGWYRADMRKKKMAMQSTIDSLNKLLEEQNDAIAQLTAENIRLTAALGEKIMIINQAEVMCDRIIEKLNPRKAK